MVTDGQPSAWWATCFSHSTVAAGAWTRQHLLPTWLAEPTEALTPLLSSHAEVPCQPSSLSTPFGIRICLHVCFSILKTLTEKRLMRRGVRRPQSRLCIEFPQWRLLQEQGSFQAPVLKAHSHRQMQYLEYFASSLYHVTSR